MNCRECALALLDYHFDSLQPHERSAVAEHLLGCPACRATLDELKTRVPDQLAWPDEDPPEGLTDRALEAVARANERVPVLALPADGAAAGEPEAAPRQRGFTVRRVLRYAAVASLVAVGGWAAHVHSQSVSLAVRVDGQDRLSPSANAALRLSVFDVDSGKAISGARVKVLLRGPDGKTVPIYEGPSDLAGTITAGTRLPDLPEGGYTLEVEADRGPDSTKVAMPVQLQRRHRVLLSTDKPTYQPGQTIHVRALARDAATGKPPAGQELVLRVLDPKGNIVGKKAMPVDAYGVGSLDFALADEILLGAWRVEAAVGGASSSTDVQVARYSLPKYQLKVTTDAPWVRPGEALVGRVEARTFFGKAVQGATLTATAGVMIDRFHEIARATGEADADGVWRFELPLPPALPGLALVGGSAIVDLELQAVDRAGQRVTHHQVVHVATEPLSVTVVPEGGAMTVGIENRLLALVVRPDGEPAPGVRVVLAQRGPTVGPNATTGEDGIAVLEYRPQDARRDLAITLMAPDGAVVHRSVEVQSRYLPGVIRTERTLYEAGQTVRGEIRGRSPVEAFYLDVVRDGTTISTQTVQVTDSMGAFAVDLPADAVGTVTLYAYTPGKDVTRSRKTIFVGDPRQLTVSIAADRETYQPGKEAKLTVQVTGEDGKPAAASVGLAVVDESVFALATKEPALLKAYFLLAEQLAKPRYQLDPRQVVTGGERRDRAAALLFSHDGPDEVKRLAATTDAELATRRAALVSNQESTSKWSWALGLVLMGVLFEGALRFLLEKVFRRFLEGKWWRTGALLVGGGLGLAAKVVYGADIVEAAVVGVVPLVAVLGVEAVVSVFQGRLGKALGFAALVAVFGVTGLTLVGDHVRRTFGTSAHSLAGKPVPPSGPREQRRMNPGFAQGVGDEGGAAWGAEPMPIAPRAPAPVAAPMEMKEEAKLAGAKGDSIDDLFKTEFSDRAWKADKKDAAKSELEQPKRGGPAEPVVDKSKVRVRTWFPETMFWAPSVITGADGTAQLGIPVADSITSWRVSAVASAADGRLGTGTSALTAFQDFFVDVDLPPFLTVGDEIELPIAVHNYLEEPQKVRVEVEEAPWFTALTPRVTELTLAAGEMNGAPLRLKVTSAGAGAFGKKTLTVWAFGSKLQDAIRRDVEVRPDGVRVEEVVSGVVGEQETVLTGKLPGGAIPGTEKVLLRVHPGVAAAALDGMEGVLRMPSGCFEQTSSATYPNVLVLDYLRRTGRSKPELELKATEYIQQGYQKLLSYEVPGGGFEWFGRAPANQVLTAYGLLEFSDMAKVYEVDPAVLRRTQAWLVSRQQPDGSFQPDASSLHDGLYRSEFAGRVGVTAYVTWALVESGYRGPATDRALAFLRGRSRETADVYTQSLIAGALVASGRTADAQDLLRLIEASAVQDRQAIRFPAGGRTAVYSGGAGADVEATALAATALQRGGRAQHVPAALEWLVGARTAGGAWPSTQATVLAMRAVLGLAGAPDPAARYQVAVGVSGERVGEVKIDGTNAEVVQTVDLTKLARPGTPLQVRVQTQGGRGRAQVQLVTTAWAPKPAAQEALALAVDYDRVVLAPDDTITARAKATWKRNEASGMVLLSLPIPPGFEIEAASVGQLVAEGKVGKFTITGKELLLYVDRLRPNVVTELPFRLRARFPVKVQSPPALAYLYYQPEVRAETTAVNLTVGR